MFPLINVQAAVGYVYIIPSNADIITYIFVCMLTDIKELENQLVESAKSTHQEPAIEPSHKSEISEFTMDHFAPDAKSEEAHHSTALDKSAHSSATVNDINDDTVSRVDDKGVMYNST